MHAETDDRKEDDTGPEVGGEFEGIFECLCKVPSVLGANKTGDVISQCDVGMQWQWIPA